MSSAFNLKSFIKNSTNEFKENKSLKDTIVESHKEDNPHEESSAKSKPKDRSELDINAALNPLIIFNISDHFQRIHLNKKDNIEHFRVIGLLLGKKSGSVCTIANSIELKVDVSKNEDKLDFKVDVAYLNKRAGHCDQLFPNLEIIGWYSVGKSVTDFEIDVYKKYFEKLGAFLFLQWDIDDLLFPSSPEKNSFKPSLNNRTNLCLTMYQMSFTHKEYSEVKDYYVEIKKTQQIALDAINQPTSGPQYLSKGRKGGVKDSKYLISLKKKKKLVDMLQSRVESAIKYLEDLESGKKKADYDLLREIGSLALKVPKSNEPFELPKEIEEKIENSLTGSLLTGVVRGVHKFAESKPVYNMQTNYVKRKAADTMDDIAPVRGIRRSRPF